MKFSIFTVLTPIILTVGLAACDSGGPEGTSPIITDPPENPVTEVNEEEPQTRRMELRDVYNEFNLVKLDHAGKTQAYDLTPEDSIYAGWKIEYEVSNLGASINRKSIKIQERNTLRDYNNAIVSSSSSTSYYEAETGALERVSFSDSGVTGWVVQEGTLPESVPLDGGEDSGILHRIDYSDGYKSTGTWQWLGKNEGYYILYVTHQESFGNEGREIVSGITTFKYYITGDGNIPFFDVTYVIPEQDVDITFNGRVKFRSLDVDATESEVNLDIAEAEEL